MGLIYSAKHFIKEAHMGSVMQVLSSQPLRRLRPESRMFQASLGNLDSVLKVSFLLRGVLQYRSAVKHQPSVHETPCLLIGQTEQSRGLQKQSCLPSRGGNAAEVGSRCTPSSPAQVSMLAWPALLPAVPAHWLLSCALRNCSLVPIIMINLQVQFPVS